MVYQGRAAIEEEFGASFEATPGSTIAINVDSVRQVASDVVMEDGRVTVQHANDGPEYVSRYAAVHVQENGHWKLASLRDLSGETSSPGEHLLELEWLLGGWLAETGDSVVEHHYGWSEDGNFIVGSFRVSTVVRVSGGTHLRYQSPHIITNGITEFDMENRETSVQAA